MKVGFFRIETPADINLAAGREFAKNFTSDLCYNQFEMLDEVKGYLQSKIAQSVRFSLERDNYVDLQEVDGPLNYSLKFIDIGIGMWRCLY